MPSILRRARIELSANWFPLDRPEGRLLGSDALLEQGRHVLHLRHEVETACDASAYRPDDLARLLTKVDQVDAMLPLQTRIVNVPYENNLGGFVLFTGGATALRPELIAYEGADSVDPDQPTDLFLTGRHLSIHETEVIAGGRLVDPKDVDIISREVVRIRIPPGAQATLIKAGPTTGLDCIEIHLATPHGVSNSLLIPLGCSSPPAEFIAEFAVDGETRKDIRGSLGPSCSIRIPASGSVLASTLAAEFTVTLAADKSITIKIDEPIPFDTAARAYVFRKSHLADLASKLASGVIANWPGKHPDKPVELELEPKAMGSTRPLRVRLTIRQVVPPAPLPALRPPPSSLPALPDSPRSSRLRGDASGEHAISNDK